MDTIELDEDIAAALEGLPESFRDFGRVYQSEIRPTLQAREHERVKAAVSARNSVIGGVAVAALGSAIAVFGFNLPQLAIAAVLGGIVWGGIGSQPMRKLSGQAKSMLVQPVAERFNLLFEETPGTVASVFDHQRVGLLPTYDRSSFEDRLTGEHGAVPFEFFECTLKQRRTTTDSKGRTRTTYVTVFNGQCLRLNFHKRFFGRTLVTRDAGWFNVFGGKSGMDRAILEDPEFEKAFEVYTTDQVEARFILTPDFMQTLVDLERTFRGKKLRCAFADEEMFIAVEGGNLFEPGSLFKPLDNPARVRELLDDFQAVFNLIDKVRARRDEQQR